MYTPQRNQLLDEVWAAMLLPVVQDITDSYTLGMLDEGEDVYHPPLTGNAAAYDAYVKGWQQSYKQRRDTMDYEDDILDREDWSRGQW